MSALVKELLLDLNKIPVEVRCDLLSSIEKLYLEGVISPTELIYLDLFASGYSAEEIALQQHLTAFFNTTTESVRQSLTRIMLAIETKSGYLDTDFVYKVDKSGKYSQHKIKQLVEFLKKHSETY